MSTARSTNMMMGMMRMMNMCMMMRAKNRSLAYCPVIRVKFPTGLKAYELSGLLIFPGTKRPAAGR